jgi:hypothetical protein
LWSRGPCFETDKEIKEYEKKENGATPQSSWTKRRKDETEDLKTRAPEDSRRQDTISNIHLNVLNYMSLHTI